MAQWVNDNNEYYDGKSIIYGDWLIINPSEEQLIEAGYHQITASSPTEEELLEAAKYNKMCEIRDYDSSDDVNIFYLSGQPLWLNAQTRQTLRTSIDAYQAVGAQQVTKWFGGLLYTFPTQMWVSMLNALEVYAAEALNVTEAHRAAVEALTTIEEVENFDVTVGYPEPLNLTPEWLALHT